jgi:hypothetical protein
LLDNSYRSESETLVGQAVVRPVPAAVLDRCDVAASAGQLKRAEAGVEEITLPSGADTIRPPQQKAEALSFRLTYSKLPFR